MNFTRSISPFDVSSPESAKKSCARSRRLRPLEDISNRHHEEVGSPLPKIYEENEDGDKENVPQDDTTPVRRGFRTKHRETNDVALTSSTPLNKRHLSTPNTPKRTPQNPFEAGLLSRLHLPICSPSVFSNVVSPSRSLNTDDEHFEWPIEDVSRIRPAAIEEFPVHQYTLHEDPETESRVQQAIDLFFKEKQIVPSPRSPSLERAVVPHFRAEQSKRSVDSKDVETQTELSLPPVLPPDLMAALRPYFNTDCSPKPSPTSSEEGYLSQSGLRRKLLFHVTEDTSGVPCSPLVSVNWDEGLPRTNLQVIRRSLRSPTLSPINTRASDAYVLPSSKPANNHTFASQVSMEVSYQHSPTTPQRRRDYVFSTLPGGVVSNQSWSLRQHLMVAEADEEITDATMDSCHGTPVLGLSPEPPFRHQEGGVQGSTLGQMSNITDQGYQTDYSSLAYMSHHLRQSKLPDFSLPSEPWAPQLGSSTPSKPEFNNP